MTDSKFFVHPVYDLLKYKFKHSKTECFIDIFGIFNRVAFLMHSVDRQMGWNGPQLLTANMKMSLNLPVWNLSQFLTRISNFQILIDDLANWVEVQAREYRRFHWNPFSSFWNMREQPRISKISPMYLLLKCCNIVTFWLSSR